MTESNKAQAVNMLGFIDFTIMPNGQLKVNRVWSKPKQESSHAIWKKKKTKFEGVEKKGEVEL